MYRIYKSDSNYDKSAVKNFTFNIALGSLVLHIADVSMAKKLNNRVGKEVYCIGFHP